MAKITCDVKEIHWVTSWKYSCLNRECPICRTELETESKDCVIIGNCGHGFHSKCISDWHKQMHKKTCPVCNKNWVSKYSNNLKTKKIYDVSDQYENINQYLDGDWGDSGDWN